MKNTSTFIFIVFLLFQVGCQTKQSNDQLTKSELYGKSADELRIMRNEIFARHGYIFKSEDLQEYFTSKEWYKPLHKDVTDLLTDSDKKNIELIVEQEKLLEEEKTRDEKRKLENAKRVVVNFKGTKKLDDYFLTVLSIYKIPVNGILREDSSYYREGHYLTSSKIDLQSSNSENTNVEKFKSIWTSSIELINPCGDISTRQLQFLEMNMFSADEQTIRFLLPECSDYTDNIFIAWRDGVMTEKFTADTWMNEEVNFKKMNDSIFYTLTDSRDEIVSAFQSDYRYEYNNRTNKLQFTKPNKQRIHWQSEALIDLTAYETLKAASEKDKSMVKFIIKAGESFYLDTLFRDFNSLYIMKDDSSGYLNTENLNYKTITTNTAG